MTRRIGRGDPQRGLARVALGVMGVATVLLLVIGTGLPSVLAGPATPSGSPTNTATDTTDAATPTQATPSAGQSIALINPSNYESPIIVSDKRDQDTLYHFVAWVNAVPTNAQVQFTLQPSGGGTASSPPGCDPATRVDTTDTWECFGDISGYPDGTYTVTATLVSNNPPAHDSQQVTIKHSAESVEILSPTDGGPLGVYAPPNPPNPPNPPSQQPAGFLMNVRYSSGTSSVKAYYTIAQPGSKPAWRRCNSQTTVYYSDNSATLGCTVAPDVNPTSITGVAAVPVFVDQPPNCIPDPQTLACAGKDQSGDAHRVFAYTQQPGGVTVAPTSQTVGKNSDNSQCAFLTATVMDQSQKPVWRANVDVHGTGPSDTLQFAKAASSDPFKAPDQGSHDGAEPAYNCTNKANDASAQEGTHAVVGPDIKHIESTTGSDVNGQFHFALHSPTNGHTDTNTWWDTNDNDVIDGSDVQAAASVDWGTPPSSSSATATATATATASTTPCPSPSSSPSNCASPTPSASSSPTPSSSPSTTVTTTTTTTTTATTSTTAPPGTDREATNVTIRYDANGRRPALTRADNRGAFKGTVGSAKNQCKRGRKIRLIRKGHGVVGRTRSNRKGNWNVFFPDARGRFYAKALRKVYFTSTAQKVVCLADKSPTIRVP